MSRTHHHRRRPRPAVVKGPASRAVRVEWSLLDDYPAATETAVQRLLDQATRLGVAQGGGVETYCAWLKGTPCQAFNRTIKAIAALLGRPERME